MPFDSDTSTLLNALLACVTLSAACAVLSVPVVLRRWAFIGEGISHSGFGGAGTAWLAALVFPAFDRPWVPYAMVVVFCFGTAMAIARVSRDDRVSSDAAIGIFLVASLAWGFLARQVYMEFRFKVPDGFETLLFGFLQDVSPHYAWTAAVVSAGVMAVVAMLSKEIIAYCFDPLMARTSGVRSGFIHYLLMFLIALVIVVGVRIAGSVLVTALLVLPGTTALTLGRRLPAVMAWSVGTGVSGAVGGLLLHGHWHFVPVGPAIVLVLFVIFVVAFTVTRVARGAAR